MITHMQGPTPEDVIVPSGATVIEETPSTGSAGRRLAAAATVAELRLRPNTESDVESPAENGPPKALAFAAGVRRRRTVLRPMRGATARAAEFALSYEFQAACVPTLVVDEVPVFTSSGSRPSQAWLHAQPQQYLCLHPYQQRLHMS